MLNRMLTNGRVQRLARGLKEPVPHVVGHLEFLLKTAYDHVPKSGKLKPPDLEAVESWACWDGKPGLFLAQLLKSNLIVQNKRGHFFGEFWKEPPHYVRMRWQRKDLEQRAGENPCSQRAHTVLPEQSRTDESRTEQSRADKRSEEARATDVAGGKETSCASGPLADCPAQAERLVKLLAQEPPAPPLFLLVGAGMDGAVARNLCSAHPPERIRQAAIYAARKSKRNPAGLIRKFLENPSWKLA